MKSIEPKCLTKDFDVTLCLIYPNLFSIYSHVSEDKPRIPQTP